MNVTLRTKTLKMADSVAYQEGSVVSRMVINKPTGTVTVFAFDLGEGLSEHTAPYDALVHILDGKAEITLAGQVFLLAEGDFLVLPANQPHALKAIERFKMVLTMIRS